MLLSCQITYLRAKSILKTTVTSLSYLGIARLLVLMSRLLFVLPARLFALTGLISDLAAISILSSYVPLCASSLTFPYLYRLSHAYVAFLL
jgi:hypothetical protein